ncbi:MAG: hypothetical protein Q9163_001519 [Psora crenata]
MRFSLVAWASFGFTALAGAQQLDPIKNMCIRFDHQSVVKNNTLYIDGGRQTFIDITNSSGKPEQTGKITQGYNTNLIAIDLAKSWDWKTNISTIALNKSANPETGTYPPVLSRGALYHGAEADENIYLWGGTTSDFNTSFPGYRSPLPSQYSLWSYDISTQTWGQYDTGLTVEIRPSSGSFTEARDQQLAFYFNGQLDSGSDIRTSSLGEETEVFIEGMIVINTANHTARNLSTKAVVGDYPRSRGQMEYCQGIGANGTLIQIGGNQKHANDYSNRSVVDLVPMDEVDIFDVSSLQNASTPDGVWYKQKTSGETPEGRLDFCLISASSPDGSSRNIYMYGGRSSNGTGDIFYDDIWVLSIPSFTWTKIYQGISPRYGHTCHRVGARTMITVGGASNNRYDELPCDWEVKGVGVFDISKAIWGSVYDADAPTYTVPAQVTATIGGDGNGGATMLQPVGGFTQEGLARLFNVPWTPPSPSDSKPKKHPIAVPIIGGIIAGVASLGLSTLLIFFYRQRIRAFLRRHRILAFFAGKEPVQEIDGTGKTQAEMMATNVCWELPASEKPAELGTPSEHAGTRSEKGGDSSPWTPPVTAQGTPF